MKLVLITDTGEQIEARCDGCRHWAALGDDKFTAVSPDWRFVDDKYEPAKRCVRLNGSVAEDNCAHGGGVADLFTVPSFGCALFEAKEKA